MGLLANIVIDTVMSEKIKADDLSELDKLKLTLATFAASLFPKCKVYINANQQSTLPPCLFIDFYSMNKQRKLNVNSKYEIGYVISYVASDAISSTELDNALFLLQQNITDIEEYGVQSVSSDITDGIANVTGTINIREAGLSDAEIIKKAEQEMNLK